MEVFPVNPSATCNHNYVLRYGCLRGGEEYVLWRVSVSSFAVYLPSHPYRSITSSNNYAQCIA